MNFMVLLKETRPVLEKMILSASGWRAVFAAGGNEESKSNEITEVHSVIAGAAAVCFAGFLGSQNESGAGKALVLVGCDTRPTGNAIARSITPALVSQGCEVQWAGITAAGEIMAWARSLSSDSEYQGRPLGFIYITASHNPIGHNGLKFGLSRGGVLAAKDNLALIAQFRFCLEDQERINAIQQSMTSVDPALLQSVYAAEAENKKQALQAYFNFMRETSFKDDAAALKNGLAKKALGIVCDFNGSSRSVSIDRDLFKSLGLKFEAINEKAGVIAHAIIPEGESLQPCRAFLERMHSSDPSFILGYTPDCDGDRGNLVIWDEPNKCARILEAQEVFALACTAELSCMAWNREPEAACNALPETALPKTAIVVNDPTSLRIEKIAEAFNVPVYRAEVGEANVTGLAQKLREKGFTVRISGEGSNGGCIFHPSEVRDPLNTVISIVKFLAIKSDKNRPGPFELWCNASNHRELYRDNFGLWDIVASLPVFVTTNASDEIAILRIKTTDHGVLKKKYQDIFISEWEEKKEGLKTRYGIYSWEAASYKGTEEKRGINKFEDTEKGGLKINFLNKTGTAIASIWMRGSATEPVFRIMADAAGHERNFERELIEWQRSMALKADK